MIEGLPNDENMSPLEDFPKTCEEWCGFTVKIMFYEVLMVGYGDFGTWEESTLERKGPR